MFNRGGIGTELFRGCTLGFMSVRIKDDLLKKGWSEEKAELAISIASYAISMIHTKSADNAALMMLLDTVIPDIFGQSPTATALKRAISIGLVLLDKNILVQAPNLNNLLSVAFSGFTITAFNYAKSWFHEWNERRNAHNHTEMMTEFNYLL